MSEMIERVGDALREACLKEFGNTWSNDVAWRFARAAIQALREPTDAMVEAGHIYGCYAAWQEMIDEALSPHRAREE